jgi:hypothetical protein
MSRCICARKCPKCRGYKWIEYTDGTRKICPECDGRGTVE